MFIVKAEVRSDIGPTTYQLFESQSVRVGKPEYFGTYPLPGADVFVSLCDADGHIYKSLEVGNSLHHYCAVYIMNAHGKTVDSVYPFPAAQGETARAA